MRSAVRGTCSYRAASTAAPLVNLEVSTSGLTDRGDAWHLLDRDDVREISWIQQQSAGDEAPIGNQGSSFLDDTCLIPAAGGDRKRHMVQVGSLGAPEIRFR